MTHLREQVVSVPAHAGPVFGDGSVQVVPCYVGGEGAGGGLAAAVAGQQAPAAGVRLMRGWVGGEEWGLGRA